MRSESRDRQPFLRMPRNTNTGPAEGCAVKAGQSLIWRPRSLDASKTPRLWSARRGASPGRARSSAEEHCLHTAGVAGSNPAAPTITQTWRIAAAAGHAQFLASIQRRSGASGAAFSQDDHRKTVGSPPVMKPCEEKLLRVSTEHGSLNVFIEYVCSYLVRRETTTRLNGASSAPGAISRRKGVSSVRPLRLATAINNWRGVQGAGEFARIQHPGAEASAGAVLRASTETRGANRGTLGGMNGHRFLQCRRRTSSEVAD